MKKTTSSEAWMLLSALGLVGIFVFSGICAENSPVFGTLLIICEFIVAMAIYLENIEQKDRYIYKLEIKNKCHMYTTTEFTRKVKHLLREHSNSGLIDLTMGEIDRFTIVIDISDSFPVYMLFEDYSDRLPDSIHDEIEKIWNEGR